MTFAHRIFTLIVGLLLAVGVQAQSLTPAQQATLKSYVENDVALNAARLSGNYGAVLDALHAAAVPSFTLWRTQVSAETIGNAWNGADIDSMSALNMQRLQLLLASAPSGVFDMTRADRRSGFEGPFGTNQNNASRVAMRAVWKRLASVYEKLFAQGTGSDTVPATPGLDATGQYIEGQLELAVLVGLWR